MKWIGIFLVVTTFFLLSKREIGRYQTPIWFWTEMEFLASYFLNELRFTCDEPLKILRRYALHKERTIPKTDSFEKAVVCFLGEEELAHSEEVVMFIQGLGTTDLEGQLAHCSRFSHIFEQRVKQAKTLYETQGKLRQKLWILAGICTFLLLL
jgi:hypothetical protein